MKQKNTTRKMTPLQRLMSIYERIERSDRDRGDGIYMATYSRSRDGRSGGCVLIDGRGNPVSETYDWILPKQGGAFEASRIRGRTAYMDGEEVFTLDKNGKPTGSVIKSGHR